jgi:hypothetical protein
MKHCPHHPLDAQEARHRGESDENAGESRIVGTVSIGLYQQQQPATAGQDHGRGAAELEHHGGVHRRLESAL